jgi:hypothetical protein
MSCVDDSLFPLHEKLAKIYSSLRTLVAAPTTPNYSAGLIVLQQELNDLENVHCINSKYVPLGWSDLKQPAAIPAGQAIISTLVARCYRLVIVPLLTLRSTLAMKDTRSIYLAFQSRSRSIPSSISSSLSARIISSQTLKIWESRQ